MNVMNAPREQDQPRDAIEVNGFIELIDRDAPHDRVLDRLRALQTRLQGDGEWERQTHELRAAIEGALAAPSDDPTQFQLKPHVITEIDRIDDADLIRYLTYRYRYDIFPITRELADYPPCVQVEPTSICNFRCVFCYQTDESFSAKGSSHMGSMTLDLFKRAIDELEGNVEAVTFASRGEPLASKAIPEMLAYVRGKFLASKMNTNASLLTEKRAHMLLEAGLQTLVFSADAAADPLYSKLRVGGTLARTMRNIERFQNIKEKHYPQSRTITRVSGVRVSDDQHADDMEAAWGGLVDQVAFVSYDAYMEAYDAPPNDITTPCSDLWRRMFLWWDGRMSPCDADYKAMLVDDRFPENSIHELWRGPRYKQLRALHLNKRRSAVKPCAGCVII